MKPVPGAANRREEPGRTRPFGFGQRLHPAFEFRFRRAVRVVVGARRLRRARPGTNGCVVIQPRPRPLVDQEIVQPRASGGRIVARQVDEHRLVARPHLAQEQRVDDLRRFDQLGEHAAIGDGQFRQIGADLGRRESRGHAHQRRCIGHHDLLRAEQCEGTCDSNQQRAGREFLCHIETSLQL